MVVVEEWIHAWNTARMRRNCSNIILSESYKRQQSPIFGRDDPCGPKSLQRSIMIRQLPEEHHTSYDGRIDSSTLSILERTEYRTTYLNTSDGAIAERGLG